MIINNKLYILLGILLFFCVVYMYPLNKIEGFNPNMNRTGIPTLIDDNTTTLIDNLLISKYRTTYEEILINLHNQTGLAILNEIVNNSEKISKNPTNKDTLEIISNINELEKFKTTLNETMEILDKN